MMSPTRDDPLLGTMTYDPGLGWYSGHATWAGATVDCQLSGETDAEIEAAAAAAGRIFADAAHWRTTLETAAATELLPLKNAHWLDDEAREAPLTMTDFLSRITPESICFFPDGGVEAFWQDGGLFAGHVILVSLDAESGAISADIAG